MKRITLSTILLACGLLLPSLVMGQKQASKENEGGSAKEVYTGTIMNMSGRAVSIGFNLTITGRTSDQEAQQYLSRIQSSTQRMRSSASAACWLFWKIAQL